MDGAGEAVAGDHDVHRVGCDRGRHAGDRRGDLAFPNDFRGFGSGKR